jgi:hypothetical protein
MLHDLTSSLGSDVVVGIAQAAGAIALCLGVVALCRWFGVNVERRFVLLRAPQVRGDPHPSRGKSPQRRDKRNRRAAEAYPESAQLKF